MFEYCSSITSLITRNFDTSNIINMLDMFTEMKNVQYLDVSNF